MLLGDMPLRFEGLVALLQTGVDPNLSHCHWRDWIVDETQVYQLFIGTLSGR